MVCAAFAPTEKMPHRALRMRALFAAVLHVVQGITAALQHKVVERNAVLLRQRRKFFVQVFGKPNGTGEVCIFKFGFYLKHGYTANHIFVPIILVQKVFQ